MNKQRELPLATMYVYPITTRVTICDYHDKKKKKKRNSSQFLTRIASHPRNKHGVFVTNTALFSRGKKILISCMPGSHCESRNLLFLASFVQTLDYTLTLCLQIVIKNLAGGWFADRLFNLVCGAKLLARE